MVRLFYGPQVSAAESAKFIVTFQSDSMNFSKFLSKEDKNFDDAGRAFFFFFNNEKEYNFKIKRMTELAAKFTNEFLPQLKDYQSRLEKLCKEANG